MLIKIEQGEDLKALEEQLTGRDLAVQLRFIDTFGSKQVSSWIGCYEETDLGDGDIRQAILLEGDHCEWFDLDEAIENIEMAFSCTPEIFIHVLEYLPV